MMCCGSQNVVGALDWMPPDAARSQDSIIVLFDWFSGQLTDEVDEEVRSKGHVIVFHGGGVLLSHRSMKRICTRFWVDRRTRFAAKFG